jgi:hypothetical protein
MNDAQLHLDFGESGLYGLGQPVQAFHGVDKTVLNAPAFQLTEQAQPNLAALALGDPQPQKLLFFLQFNAQGQVDRTVVYWPFLPRSDHGASK